MTRELANTPRPPGRQIEPTGEFRSPDGAFDDPLARRWELIALLRRRTRRSVGAAMGADCAAQEATDLEVPSDAEQG